MKEGVWYVVTKGSDDETLLEGDHIKLLPTGELLCKEAKGRIEKKDVPESMKGLEYEIDKAAIARMEAKIRKLQGELDDLLHS